MYLSISLLFFLLLPVSSTVLNSQEPIVRINIENKRSDYLILIAMVEIEKHLN